MFPSFKEYSEAHPHHLFFLGLALFSSSALYLERTYPMYPYNTPHYPVVQHVVKHKEIVEIKNSIQPFPAVVTSLESGLVKVDRALVIIPKGEETSKIPPTEPKTLKVSIDTKTTKVIEKDPTLFAKEKKAYDALVKSAQVNGSSQLAQVPSRFVTVPATKDDVKVGDSIFVKTTEDPKTSSVLSALEINIFPKSFAEFFGIQNSTQTGKSNL